MNAIKAKSTTTKSAKPAELVLGAALVVACFRHPRLDAVGRIITQNRDTFFTKLKVREDQAKARKFDIGLALLSDELFSPGPFQEATVVKTITLANVQFQTIRAHHNCSTELTYAAGVEVLQPELHINSPGFVPLGYNKDNNFFFREDTRERVESAELVHIFVNPATGNCKAVAKFIGG